MLGAIISLIFLVVVLGALFWAGQTLLARIPLAEPFRTILYVLMVLLTVVLVLYVLSVILGLAGIHVPILGSVR